jgi:hypothetical protein
MEPDDNANLSMGWSRNKLPLGACLRAALLYRRGARVAAIDIAWWHDGHRSGCEGAYLAIAGDHLRSRSRL